MDFSCISYSIKNRLKIIFLGGGALEVVRHLDSATPPYLIVAEDFGTYLIVSRITPGISISFVQTHNWRGYRSSCSPELMTNCKIDTLADRVALPSSI